jgi:hypothetical protein
MRSFATGSTGAGPPCCANANAGFEAADPAGAERTKGFNADQHPAWL